MTRLGVAALTAILLLSATCANSTAVGPSGPFQVGWSPETGRGPVTLVTSAGDRYTACFQCGYRGYAGGLGLGNMGASGFEWVPARPIAGFPAINLFCAQDESFLDRTTRTELDLGWSQNFGSGADGETLVYAGGQVLESGPRRVVLGATNRHGCYDVTKLVRWGRDEAYLSIATIVRNVCEDPILFDLWTGDDPWLGRYLSAEGDIGWWNGGLVRLETSVEPVSFVAGGIYDLGNSVAGDEPGSFSNTADFLMPSPRGPHPDRVLFAGAFAHDKAELVPGLPLDGKQMVAINLGWLDVGLAPGEEWSVVYALGRADTGSVGTLPAAPDIAPEAWTFHEAARKAYRPIAAAPRASRPRAPARPIVFQSEEVHLTLHPDALAVEGRYRFRNDADAESRAAIRFPFPVDAAHPFPVPVMVDAEGQRSFERAVGWSLTLAPREVRDVTVRYLQPLAVRDATYITTSALAWKRPLEHARFVVRWPRSLGNVQVTLPLEYYGEGDEIVGIYETTDFVPLRDVRLAW